MSRFIFTSIRVAILLYSKRIRVATTSTVAVFKSYCIVFYVGILQLFGTSVTCRHHCGHVAILCLSCYMSPLCCNVLVVESFKQKLYPNLKFPPRAIVARGSPISIVVGNSC